MKNPRIAEIVPVNSLSKIAYNQYFMCLAQLLGRNRSYDEFHRIKINEGRFVLLDNGAAEKSSISCDELIRLCDKLRPAEVILLDELGGGQASYEKTIFSLKEFNKANLSCRLMAVPQGQSIKEWIYYAKKLLEYPEINTIGVPKVLKNITGIENAREIVVSEIDSYLRENKRDDIEIHLLGCSEGPSVIKKAIAASRFVRGCDSAIGYLYAQAGIDTVTEDMGRPSGEIDFLHGPDFDCVEKSLLTFERSCGIIDNGVSQTWSK